MNGLNFWCQKYVRIKSFPYKFGALGWLFLKESKGRGGSESLNPLQDSFPEASKLGIVVFDGPFGHIFSYFWVLKRRRP